MKKSLALLAFVAVLIQNSNAGSAVAWDGRGHLVTMYGHPKTVAVQRALETAHRRYGAGVRLIASTDSIGYGAIAIAHKRNGPGLLIGVALAKRSATEADTLAIEQCLKAGGTNPQVKWAWRG